MRMSEIGYEGLPPIDSYGGGGFRIQNEFLTGDLMLSPTGGVAPWTAGDIGAGAFATFIDEAAEVDVLLVGMGAEIAALPRAARTALEDAGIGVEIMSTPSACRTYNVLLAEGRRVAAALIAI